MNFGKRISAGLIAAAMVYFAFAPLVPQSQPDRVLQTDRQLAPIVPQRFGYETVEESWGCEYMMEFPGTCIMRV